MILLLPITICWATLGGKIGATTKRPNQKIGPLTHLENFLSEPLPQKSVFENFRPEPPPPLKVEVQFNSVYSIDSHLIRMPIPDNQAPISNIHQTAQENLRLQNVL